MSSRDTGCHQPRAVGTEPVSLCILSWPQHARAGALLKGRRRGRFGATFWRKDSNFSGEKPECRDW